MRRSSENGKSVAREKRGQRSFRLAAQSAVNKTFIAIENLFSIMKHHHQTWQWEFRRGFFEELD